MTWKGDPRWIPSAWFHFHSCQTWYSGLPRIVLMAHQCWYHQNIVNRLGWSRIRLAVLILNAAGAGLIGRPAVAIINATHYSYRTTTHTFRHCNTHTFMQDTATRNWSWEMIMGFEALYAGRGRRNPVWSGKEAHWSLRGLIVKSAEHCGADYKPLDR